jgi:hypothetical protein
MAKEFVTLFITKISDVSIAKVLLKLREKVRSQNALEFRKTNKVFCGRMAKVISRKVPRAPSDEK